MTPNPRLAAKFRALANTMQATIDAKRDPAITSQNRTPRRIQIAQQMARDADRLALIQKALRKLADYHAQDPAYDKPAQPISLNDANSLIAAASRADVERLSTDVLTKFVGASEADPRRAIREMEDSLVGLKIDGFFPTPAETADLMVERLAFCPHKGQTLLEPSAGKGDLLEAVERAFTGPRFRDQLYACEINGRLRGILATKGYTLTPQYDSLQLRAEDRLYDRVIMNPAFEHGHDQAEVWHCFRLLKPGGRLVSIVSEANFFRSGLVWEDFRAFLADRQVEEPIRLDRAFKGAQSFRQTGVAARIITLQKPSLEAMLG